MRVRHLAFVLLLACSKKAQPSGPPPVLDVYVVDDAVNAFVGHAKDAPFPALSDGSAMIIPREHEDPLRNFVATVPAPEGHRIFVGVRSGDDSFSRTFTVVVPPAVGGDHVTGAGAEDAGGWWRVALRLDDAGKAALAGLKDARVAIVLDGRVVASAQASTLDARHLPIRLAKSVTKEEAEAFAARFPSVR